MKASAFLLALLSVLPSIAPAGAKEPPYFDATELTPYWPSDADAVSKTLRPAAMTPFSVVDQNGRAVAEKDLANGISLVNFFFADCPGICPTMMKNIQRFRERLGTAKETVRIYSFSVKPEADTPAKLRAYAKSYGIDPKTWALLTGDREVIYGLGKGVFKADGSVGNQKSETSFIHTKNIYLVDRALRIRGVYDTSDRSAMSGLAEDIAKLNHER